MLLLIAVAAAVGWIGLRRGVSARSAQLAGDSARADAAKRHVDTLGRGETLDQLLRRGGLDGPAVTQLLTAAPMIDPRRVQPGLPVEFTRENPAAPASAVLFKLDVDRTVRLTRVNSTQWRADEARLPWFTDTIVVRGAVASNLYDAVQGPAAKLFPGQSRDALVVEVADVYKFRVDMSRELQRGDSLHAVIVRMRGPEATTRVKQVLASRLFVGGKPIEAFHFERPGITNVYFDGAGKSLATAFLRSPIEFARITSAFGLRFHPILRIRRPHEGVDYGAASGTPVQAIGDGTVTRASGNASGNAGGYGNVVEVRHPNGFMTRYAHLSRFGAKGRSGTRVQQGDVIGYVGQTGLATAPHLHFEILVGGQQTSPTRALRNVGGTPLPGAAWPAFEKQKGAMLALLTRAPGVVHGERNH